MMRLTPADGAEEAKVVHPIVLFRIPRLFRYGMSSEELYHATRQFWRMGLRREKAELAFAVFDGIVQEVYRIVDWYPAGTTFSTRSSKGYEKRWEFVGRVAEPEIRDRYLLKSVGSYFSKRAQNPISYINVDP